MNKEQNAYEQLTKGIKIYVNKEVDSAKFDKTYIGRITTINSNNTYSVEINTLIYDNIKTMGGECELNEMVKIKAPQNNMNNMYIEKYSGGGGGEIPIATTETLGGIIVGKGLKVNEDGTLDVMIKQGYFMFNCRGFVGGLFGNGVFA